MSWTELYPAAIRLASARVKAEAVSPGELGLGQLSSEQAFRIEELVRMVLLGPEHRWCCHGYKAGGTDESSRDRLGVERPFFASVTTPGRSTAPRSDREFVSPLAEPELALVMAGHPARRDEAGLVDAIAAVRPSFELVDVRIAGWDGDVGHMLCDSAFAAGMVLGPELPADLLLEPAALRFEYSVGVETGWADPDVLSPDGEEWGPLAVLNAFLDWCAERGRRLVAGDVLLTGSLAPARPVNSDTMVSIRHSLGRATVTPMISRPFRTARRETAGGVNAHG